MTNGLGVLMLLTDGFGGLGGIAKFNRDFLQALDACALVERVYALPRLIPQPIEEAIPEAVVYDRKAARGRLAFLRRLASHTWRYERIDLVCLWSPAPAPGGVAGGAASRRPARIDHPWCRGLGTIAKICGELAGA